MNLQHCGLALLMAAGGTTATEAQWSIDELRISEAETHRHVHELALPDELAEAVEAVGAGWRQNFDGLVEARRQFCDWLYANDLSYFGRSNDQRLGEWVYRTQQRVMALLNASGRELEDRYFDQLGAVTTDQPDVIESFRRGHLRSRMVENRTPWQGSVAGLSLDLPSLIADIVPSWRDNEQLTRLTLEYESELHSLLKRLDHAAWSYSDTFRGLIDRAREARKAGASDLSSRLENVARVMVQRHELYPVIRSLNRRTVDQVADLLPQPARSWLLDRVNRMLHPYVFEHDNAAAARLRLAQARTDLTPDQQEALRQVAVELAAAQRVAMSNLGALYDRTISVESYWAQFREWVRGWANNDRMALTREQLAFDEAVSKWQERERSFAARMAAALGDPQFAAVDLQPDQIIPHAGQRPSQFFDDHWRPMFSPDVIRKGFERFAQHVSASDESVRMLLTTRYERLCQEYAACHAEFRERVTAILARQEAFERLHPEVDTMSPLCPDFGWMETSLQWQARRREMEERFASDVAAIVTRHDDAKSWRDQLREARRRKSLPTMRGEMLRFAIDLGQCLEPLHLTEAERISLQSPLESYSAEIDALLKVHDEQGQLHQRLIAERDACAHDAERNRLGVDLSQAMESLMSARNTIHQATVRSISLIASALHDEHARQFLDAVDRQAYPQLFVTDPVERAASALHDAAFLSADEHATIDSIVASHRQAQQALRARIIEATPDWESPENARRRQAAYQQLPAEHRPDDIMNVHAGNPAAALLLERVRLTETACRQIRSTLRVEQCNMLPPGARLLLDWPD